MIISTASVPKSENESCWSSYEPEIWIEIPLGKSILSIMALPSATTSPNGTPEITADTVTTRSRSLRSMVGGAERSTTLPRSFYTDTITGRCIDKNVLQIFNLCTKLGSITYTDVVLITILTIIRSQSSVHAITQITGSG